MHLSPVTYVEMAAFKLVRSEFAFFFCCSQIVFFVSRFIHHVVFVCDFVVNSLVMITGDKKETAVSVAQQIGLIDNHDPIHHSAV